MTADPHGWPDPSRPGVPLNPERDGWHWVRTPDEQDAPYQWRAAGECERGRWDARWIFEAVQEWDPRLGTYLCPCHTPAEVAALVATARREGAEAMREKAAAHVGAIPEWRGQDYYCDSCKNGAIYPDRDDVAAAIRALPIPEDKP